MDILSEKTKRKSLWIALISTLVAVGIHIYLAIHYYELNLGLSSGSAICNVSETMNCDAVAASSYSSFLGVPIAVWGSTTNAVLFILILIAALNLTVARDQLLRLAFYLSAFIALVSVIMGGIAFTQISIFCLFCIIEYVLSFISLGALYNTFDEGPVEKLISDIKSVFKEMKWVGVAIILILPLSYLFNSMWLDTLGGPKLNLYLEDAFTQWQSETPINFTENGLRKGPEKSFMTIVEFADFRCPHCKHAATSLQAFTSSHPDVKFIFKAFPLDGGCNSNTQMQPGDGVSCYLAKTVACSEQVFQKGWVAYDILFKNQDEVRDISQNLNVSRLLTEQKINMDLISQCVQTEEIHKSILNQSQEGVSAQVQGTPAIFVNGKKLKMGQSITLLEKIYIFLKNQNKN